MERESKILVSNGLSNDFYSNLQEQDVDDVMFDQMLEEQMEQQMFDQMLEDQMEQQMFDQMLEEQMEQHMFDQMLEDQMEQQMLDQMLEDQMEQQMFYGGSSSDEQVDYWIAIYNDYSTVTSKDRGSLSTNNLLFYIHKVFSRASKTGKTAYFDFHMLDPNFAPTQLRIGDYYCDKVESEHWVSWEYSGVSILENHFLTNSQKNNKDFSFPRSMIYPIDYTFASILPLSNCNPKRFNFKKLNFLKNGDSAKCGDKLSRLIIKNAKDHSLEISIFEFEKNIISLLKELNESYSINDFVIKKQVKYAIEFLEVLDYNPNNDNNTFKRLAYNNIIESIEVLTSNLYKFIPRPVKENVNSEVNKLINKFKIIQN